MGLHCFVFFLCNFKLLHVRVIMQIQMILWFVIIKAYFRVQVAWSFVGFCLFTDAYRLTPDTLMSCAHFNVICDSGKWLECGLTNVKRLKKPVDLWSHMKPLSHDFNDQSMSSHFVWWRWNDSNLLHLLLLFQGLFLRLLYRSSWIFDWRTVTCLLFLNSKWNDFIKNIYWNVHELCAVIYFTKRHQIWTSVHLCWEDLDIIVSFHLHNFIVFCF